MCGIFGILSNTPENIYQVILEGLIQLQNRGYDSSGFCVYSKGEFQLAKYASTNEDTSIKKLKDMNLEMDVKDTHWIGIGHNRWATHGGKTDINSHPHISNDGNIAIVHNGIIENYQEIKKELVKEGFQFYSQTDTEVIVNLISSVMKDIAKDESLTMEQQKIYAIENTISRLQGTYGIILMFQTDPTTIYCFKNGSPILIGENENSVIITSEQSGFCNRMNDYFILNNDDICVIHRNLEDNKINIHTTHTYARKPITVRLEELNPHPFQHWTIKEIFDQPNTILNAINRGGRIKNKREVKLGGLEEHIDIIQNIDNIIILGCGTSYHAGLYGMHFLKSVCNFNIIQVIDGAEFNINDIPKIGKTACIFISQSGETKDLHRCIEIANKYNIFTIGIINVVDSLIAREVQCGIYCNAGKEIGVASTKSFTSQVICLSLFAIWCAQVHGWNETKRVRMIHDLHNLSNNVKKILENEEIQNNIQTISKEFTGYSSMFLLGKGTDECIAREGALKIKEITYIHAEAYSSSALKHGPFALLDANLPTILFDCCKEHRVKNQNCFEEVHSRHSPILFITNDTTISSDRCWTIHIETNYTFSSLLAIIPIQLFSYYISIYKNINPDIPKNLAKVVTVE
jgi:glucosamine--fructose-6-phosphate aminotransferase (isomerizing)